MSELGLEDVCVRCGRAVDDWDAQVESGQWLMLDEQLVCDRCATPDDALADSEAFVANIERGMVLHGGEVPADLREQYEHHRAYIAAARALRDGRSEEHSRAVEKMRRASGDEGSS